ncbi:Arylsulfatase A or related enzyme [Halapricum desulfuricans]|uniref:Arylsulfatase A or related enzyme n=2 Tax=Halapricum desulfuricans TaxID=2841257 RepID=A0A897N996_9EURY|nr:Arylsulfatase A or related enzyme [Halapricum desulfuricans]
MPVLDELAANGTVFTQAFSNGPYTRVSIPSFHTSRYLAYGDLDVFSTISSALDSVDIRTAAIGTQTGIGLVPGKFNFDELIDLGRDEFEEEETEHTVTERTAAYIDTIAAGVSECLQRRGLDALYRTLKRPYNALFDDVTPFRQKGYTSAAEVTDRAITWLETQDDGDFFLWVHYMEAHRPYGIHDENPAYLDGPCDEERIRDLMETGGTEPEEISRADRELMINLYDSDLRYCSRHLSRLFDAFREEGLWEDTNWIFSSDHGEEFGEHGLYFHRNFPYDELIHVPLIFKGSDRSEPSRIDSQRELLDLAPTICSLHGIDSSEYRFLGTPLFEGEDRNVVSLGQPGMDEPAVALRADGWKYIHTPKEELLFDLSTDPEEQDNIAQSNSETVSRLRQRIPDRLFGRDPKSPRPPKDDVDREQLEALGYMELRETGKN